eukprot:TRINITY_DN5293_c0_g2_i1.p1 TRINITY_DN5293_c0_g2~~TRINITY_DN5293_c0_g2_i1.p1  ORF type:complete len:302 (-),score=76.81 TRINITY_DN5293_c0_g2_i1:58-963(-)
MEAKESGRIDCIRFSDSKDAFLVGTSVVNSSIWKGFASVWEVVNNQLKEISRIETSGGNTGIAWIGSKGDIIASCGDDGTIYYWNLMKAKKEKPIRTFVGHDDVITSLDVNIDKESLVTSSFDLSVRLWSGADEGHTKLMGHIDLVWQTKWHPEGNLIASVSQDRTTKLWDKRTHTLTSSLTSNAALYAVDWNPHQKDQFVISGEDGIVSIYDQRNLKESLLSNDHSRGQAIHTIEFSSQNPNLIAIGTDSGSTLLLDASNNTIKSLNKSSRFVRACSWSRKSPNMLVTGDWNQTLKVFQL